MVDQLCGFNDDTALNRIETDAPRARFLRVCWHNSGDESALRPRDFCSCIDTGIASRTSFRLRSDGRFCARILLAHGAVGCDGGGRQDRMGVGERVSG